MSRTHDYFLSSLQQGLAAAIGARATGPRAEVDVLLTPRARAKATGDPVDPPDPIRQTLRLYGPGDVLGFHDRVVVRTDPRADTGDAEPNYFAAIEFGAPDFAWRFTPDVPGAAGLTPWITLVVLVAEARGDTLPEFEEMARTDRALPRSIRVPDASVLPAFEHAARWAHVHVTGPAGLSRDEVLAILRTAPEQAVCRLLCPRRLRTGTRYAALVVPTFDLGRRAGVGEPIAEDAPALAPAWSGDGPVVLPYYFRWEFRTGMRGDFEHLVRLLEPRRLTGLGLRDVDCAAPGFGVAGADRVLAVEGALRSTDTVPTPWGADAADPPPPAQTELAALLNRPENAMALPVPVLDLADTEAITGIRATAAGRDTELTIRWRTAAAATGRVEIGRDAAWHTFKERVAVTDHVIAVSEIQPGVEYGIRIIAVFEDGTVAQTADGTLMLPVSSVVPPVYGRWHAARLGGVDPDRDTTWIDVLNLDPRHRVAAGLGAGVVRQRQEALMAEAWKQYGDADGTRAILRRAQFGRESATRAHTRLSELPAADLLTALAPVARRVMIDDPDASPDATAGDRVPAHRLLTRESRLPPAVLDGAFRRIARARGPLRRRQTAGRPAGVLPRLLAGELRPAGPPPEPLGMIRICTVSARLREQVPALVPEPGGTGVPAGGGTLEPGVTPVPPPVEIPAPTPIAPFFCDGRLTAADLAAGLAAEPFAPVADAYDPAAAASAATAVLIHWLERPHAPDSTPPIRNSSFIEAVGASLLQGLDPERTFVARARRRLRLAPGLEERFEESGRDPLDDLLSAPEFPQPMYVPLRELSQDYLLPGVERIPRDTIGLLESNRRFIESYMCGLNHEFAGELLWREYPTDQRGTYFRQFWDVSEYALRPHEVAPLADAWRLGQGLPSFDTMERDVKEWIVRIDPVAAAEAAPPGDLRARLLGGDEGAIREIADEDVLTELARMVAARERLAERLKDVTPLTTWGQRALGTNRPGAGTDPDDIPEPLVLVIRGQLLQRYPNARVYAVDALEAPDGTRAPGLPEYLRRLRFATAATEQTRQGLDAGNAAGVTQAFADHGRDLTSAAAVHVIVAGARWLLIDSGTRYEIHDAGDELRVYETVPPATPVFPVFHATLPTDLTFFGFPFDDEAARGSDGTLGKYFVLEERIGEPRFGLDLAPGGALDTWNDLSWDHFGLGGEDAIGAYLDDAAADPRPNAGSHGESWLGDAMSSARRARVTLQRPVRVCIHASRMLPARPSRPGRGGSPVPPGSGDPGRGGRPVPTGILDLRRG